MHGKGRHGNGGLAVPVPHFVICVAVFAPQPKVAVEHSQKVVCTKRCRRPQHEAAANPCRVSKAPEQLAPCLQAHSNATHDHPMMAKVDPPKFPTQYMLTADLSVQLALTGVELPQTPDL